VQKDKGIFKLEKYPLEEYAASLGLPGAPKIKFLKADAEEVKKRKNASRQAAISDSESEKGSGDEKDAKDKGKEKNNGVRTKIDRMFQRQNQDILADHYAKIRHKDEDGSEVDVGKLDGEQESDDDLFDVKKRIPADGDFNPDAVLQEPAEEYAKTIHIPGAKEGLVLDSKRREKMLKSKKQLLKLKGAGQKLVFDDDGNAHQLYELEDEKDFRARGEAEDQRRKFLEEEAERVQAADVDDKELVKEKRRAKKDKRKERERAEAEGSDDEDAGEGLDFDNDGNEDAMANFLADAGSASEDGSESEEEQPRKKQKKWFQRDMPEEPQHRREIETMDDLEAEAARLLG
jgi:ATP-dependent RNA helicase DDX10/DBP4